MNAICLKFLLRSGLRGFGVFIAAIAAFASEPVHAADVRVFMLAPVPPHSLKTVETQGSDKPVFAHSYAIPYASAETQIRKEIQSKANIDTGEQTVGCDTDLCPDAHWRVTTSSDFNFTQTKQPVVTAFGDPQANGVDVALTTQVRLRLNIHARLWIEPLGGTVEKTVDVPIELLIGVTAGSKLNLWPEIKSVASYCDVTKANETTCVKLTLDGKNIDLSDAKGTAVELGAALGGLIGATPIGAVIGGPLGGLLVGALGSNEAAKIAESRIQAEADQVLNALLQVASIRATWLASSYVDAKATTANAIKAMLLNTKLPQINKSYQELADAFGLSFDVQTTTPADDVNVIITPRFSGSGGGVALAGKFRMPKEACVYMRGPMGYLPMGLVKVNQDLASKAGASCASLVSAANMKTSGYLGANPTSAKAGGKSLPTWQAVGSPAFTGAMSIYSHGISSQARGGLNPREPTGYYECSFTIANAPRADIVEISVSGKLQERLTGYFDKASRYVEVTALGQQAVLDDDWKPMTGGLVVGGEGDCTSGKVIVPHFQARSWLDRMHDLFDPNKCANCRITLNQGMLEITNSDPVLQNPALKPMFDALERGQPLPAAVKGPATQAPATQRAPEQKGILRAPVQRPQLQQPGMQKGTQLPK